MVEPMYPFSHLVNLAVCVPSWFGFHFVCDMIRFLCLQYYRITVREHWGDCCFVSFPSLRVEWIDGIVGGYGVQFIDLGMSLRSVSFCSVSKEKRKEGRLF